MYKSNVEKYFAQKCLQLKINFIYEQSTFTVLSKEEIPHFYEKKKNNGVLTKANVSRSVSYTPDFVLPDLKWFVEVKGTFFQDRSFPIIAKLFLRHIKSDDVYKDYNFAIVRTKKGVDNFLKMVLTQSNSNGINPEKRKAVSEKKKKKEV